MDNKLYLGIDYGGNAVKAGLVDHTGQLSARFSRPTVSLSEKVACRAFAAEIAGFVHGYGLYSSELGGIGMAIPGVIRAEGFLTPNVKADWDQVLDSLSHALGKPDIAVVNDANAAALGELWMGAGSSYHSALLVTLGSAIGAGLVVDGNVVSGGHGAAGEVGHLTVVPDGRLCKCGRRGCVERYASARGLVQTFQEVTEEGRFDGALYSTHEPAHETDALAVFEAARDNDPRALFAIADMAEKLGYALAQVACVVDPEVILLGGGLSQASAFFLDGVRAAFKEYAFAGCADTEIVCASLLGDAGIIGAARYAMLAAPRDGSSRDLLDPDFGL